MKLATAEIMRELDRRTIEEVGIPGIVLMENAGAGCARFILSNYEEECLILVSVICGIGNNGGDGFVIARHLWNAGYPVEIFIIGKSENIRGDARTNFEIVDRMGLPITEVTNSENLEILKCHLQDTGLIVDALFGTGLTRNLDGNSATVVDAINNSGTTVVSVDVPSGLNVDLGVPNGCAVFADSTVTFGLPKLGLFIYPGYLYSNNVHVVDISIPKYLEFDIEIPYNLIESMDVFSAFLPRDPEAHKGTFGHLLVIGGSPGLTGAAALASMAALRTGAGLVTLGIPKDLNVAMEAKLTEVMTTPLPQSQSGALSLKAKSAIMKLAEGKSCVAVGPGIGRDLETAKLVRALIKDLEAPIVLDADGIWALSQDLSVLKDRRAPTIITPHPGEMGMLTGTSPKKVNDNRIQVAQNFAAAYDAIVVLKGSRTVVADPNGNIYINTTGNPGMATGGSGDVLTGIISGLLCQPDLDVLDSVIAGVYLHGYAGDLAKEKFGEMAMIAGDITDTIPAAIKNIQDYASFEIDLSDEEEVDDEPEEDID